MHLTSAALGDLEHCDAEFAAGRRSATKPFSWGRLKDGFFGAQRPKLAHAQPLQQEDLARVRGYATRAVFANQATGHAAKKPC
eukprot:8455922-Alexandrium_andersonii.AAC.1